MQSVGNTLRQAREAKRLTLSDINTQTRIPTRSLEAIEADNTAVINSPFLYRSFVRQIAAAIGVDFDLLASGTQVLADAMPQPLIPGEGSVGVPSVPPLPVNGRKRGKWVTSVASLIAIVAACSGIYAGWETYQLDPSKTLTYLRNSITWLDLHRSPQIVRVRSAILSDSTSLSQSSTRLFRLPDELNVDSGFTIQLSAVEPTWLSIVADGRPSFTGTLESAQIKILEGRETARIRTGNAGGVNVVFNGRQIGPLGPRGQVRTALFTRDGYQVLEDRAALLPVTWSGGSLQFLHPALLSPLF